MKKGKKRKKRKILSLSLDEPEFEKQILMN